MNGVCMAYNYGGFQPEFVRSAIMASGADRGRLIKGVLTVGSLYIDNGRNKLVEMFLEETDCEWLWYLDTDIEFPVDTLPRLLQETRSGARKIVSVPYWVQHPEGNYCCWLRVVGSGYRPYVSIPQSGTIKLGACGMGCTLIHRQVFEDVKAMPRDPRDPWVWFGRDLLDIGYTNGRAGEDVSFCVRAAAAGHDTWGVCGMLVNHYKTHAVTAPEAGASIGHVQHSRRSGLLIPG